MNATELKTAYGHCHYFMRDISETVAMLCERVPGYWVTFGHWWDSPEKGHEIRDVSWTGTPEVMIGTIKVHSGDPHFGLWAYEIGVQEWERRIAERREHEAQKRMEAQQRIRGLHEWSMRMHAAKKAKRNAV